ncbi:hypothetical protein VPH35_077234 [Triticum aestivum]|uniref:Uncharacterized protein n=1 Tax=Aegilops tauschii TaxID=37682 RepID=N1QYK0_AEGTA
MVIIGGDADVNEEDDVDQFRVVKQTRCAAVGRGAESSTRAAVAGGAAASSAADAEASGEGVEVAAGQDVERTSQSGRIRASPGWFAKFNSSLSPLQKSELVSRGRIHVDADSVHRVFDLPNKGQKVRYVVDKDATRRFREAFNITGDSHPQITTCTFLAPTTAVKLSPKCCELVLDHEMLKNTNICLFVAEHIDEAFRNMDQEKQTVSCCLYHLMILYLDALVHDIPVSNCAI